MIHVRKIAQLIDFWESMLLSIEMKSVDFCMAYEARLKCTKFQSSVWYVGE